MDLDIFAKSSTVAQGPGDSWLDPRLAPGGRPKKFQLRRGCYCKNNSEDLQLYAPAMVPAFSSMASYVPELTVLDSN